MKKITNFLFLLTICAALVNCSEADISAEPSEVSTEVLAFSSKAELQTYWDKVKALSSDELVAFEESNGFMSMQRKADQVMSELSEMNFGNEQEIEQYVRNNARFIRFEGSDEERTIVRVNKETTNHLIANERGVYQLEDKAFKLFNEGLISAPANAMNQLKELNEFSDGASRGLTIEYDYESDAKALKARGGHCNGMESHSFGSNGKNRTVTKIAWEIEFELLDYRQKLVLETQVSAYYRFARTWVPVRRTLTGYFKYSGAYNINLGSYTPVDRISHRPVGVHDYRWLNKLVVTSTTNPLNWYGTKFYNYWGWGDSPSTATGYVACSATTACANNSCVAPPGNLCAFKTCPPGYRCSYGNCVLIPNDPCQGVSCPNDKICRNGQCIDDPNACTVVCPRGLICVGNRCMAE